MKHFMTLSVLFILTLTSYGSEVISLKTRKSITQDLLVLEPKTAPKAVVLLFPGGSGRLMLHKDVQERNLRNFLIRSRKLFETHGFVVMSVDAPSDKRTKEGMYFGFRTSDEHLKDVQAIISYAKERYDKPIWLIGTSRGSESVAFIASQTNLYLSGIVLSSSITQKNKKGASLLDLELENISVPTLIIAHEKDTCAVTPPKNTHQLFSRLAIASRKEMKLFQGGKNEGNPCKAMSYHGFFGIEEEVVKEISRFILHD